MSEASAYGQVIDARSLQGSLSSRWSTVTISRLSAIFEFSKSTIVIRYIWTGAFLEWTAPGYANTAIHDDVKRAGKLKITFIIVKSVLYNITTSLEQPSCAMHS